VTFHEQDPPRNLYLAVVVVRIESKSHIYRSKPYDSITTARMRLTTMRREWEDVRDGWIETCAPVWARVDRAEPGKRRRCVECRRLNLTVFDREVPGEDRSTLSCADCFDRYMEFKEGTR
jgi:hypothetical protein